MNDKWIWVGLLLFIGVIFASLSDGVQLFGGGLFATFIVVWLNEKKHHSSTEDDHQANLMGQTILFYLFGTLPLIGLGLWIFD
jgi:hypothetical protein